MARGATKLGSLTLGIRLGEGLFDKSSKKVTGSFNKMIKNLRQKSKIADKSLGLIVSTMRGIGKAASLAGRTIATGLAVGLTGAATLLAAIKEVSDSITQLQRDSSEFGVSIQDLFGIRAASDLIGADAERLLDVYKDAREKLGIALNEQSGELYDAMLILGIDPAKLSENIDDVLDETIRRVNGQSPARQRAIMGMIAGAGADLNIEDFAALIVGKDLKREAPAFWAAVTPSQDSIDKAKEIGVSFKVITATLQKLKIDILSSDWIVSLIKFVEEFAAGLSDLGLGDLDKLFSILKNDFQVLATYFVRVMSWAAIEAGKQISYQLKRAVAEFVDFAPPTIVKALALATLPLTDQPPLVSLLPDLNSEAFKLDEWFKERAKRGGEILDNVKKKLADAKVESPEVSKPGTLDNNMFSGGVKAVEEQMMGMFNRIHETRVKGELAIEQMILDRLQSIQDKRLAGEQASEQMALDMFNNIHAKKVEAEDALQAQRLRNAERFGDTVAQVLQASWMRGSKVGMKFLLRLIQTQLLKTLGSTIAKGLGGLSGGGGFLGGALKLFGFRKGGQFTVGGSGGPDSQLVQFMSSPRERVTVETPQQQRGGSGSGDMSFAFDFAGANIYAQSNEDMVRWGERVADVAESRIMSRRRRGRLT